jgi:signal transduction histidine kinase
LVATAGDISWTRKSAPDWTLQLPHPAELDSSVAGSTTEHNGSSAAIRYLQSLVERDKTALARELHDDLGGYLAGTAMDIAELKRRFATYDQGSAHLF